MSSNKLYTINVEGMDFHAFHGCYELERRTGCHFTVDASIRTALGDVAAKDDVTLAVNYLTVYEVVRECMAEPKHTIECVAQSIIDALRGRFPQIESLRVRVTKMAPPLGGKVAKVSVELEG